MEDKQMKKLTFTTETKLNVMVDGLSFEKEFKE